VAFESHAIPVSCKRAALATDHSPQFQSRRVYRE
jgi:hypothetical protein